MYNIENRRYLGAKTKLLPFIEDVIKKENIQGETFLDLFGGTGVVANHFTKDYSVTVNDLLKSNTILYSGWFEGSNIDSVKVDKILLDYNNIDISKIRENYFSKNFSDTYFTKENCKLIGYIRNDIEKKYKNKHITLIEKNYLITSLIYSLDSIANTVGHYDAYRKKELIQKKLVLQHLNVNTTKDISIYNLNANILVKQIKADITYIDPPYNSRQYSDAYHLLENIATWEKPEVFGVAKKMDRTHIKSDYCTVRATESFRDLIENIESKYIIVSFNNMEQKGAGRSQSKITNNDMYEILSEKGHTTIHRKQYKYYSTGKSSVKNHEELLFVCKVEEKIKENNPFLPNIEQQPKYIKSPMNYTGGKYKILDQITSYFPTNVNTFYDIFGGGGNVGVNMTYSKIMINDINKNVIDTLIVLKEKNKQELIKEINEIISYYKLSNTKVNGYQTYGTDSSSGVGKYNKDNYEKMRADYNSEKHGFDKKVMFLVLIIFSFNNQIRFNSKGEFNMPVGKRDFNSKLEKRMLMFMDKIQNEAIVLENKDFTKIKPQNDDFVYADPPYFIATASYNESNGWTEKDEIRLYKYLDKLSQNGIKFALSNVTYHKGTSNNILLNWIKENNYKKQIINLNYNNSNYQSRNKENYTEEVLITNY